MSLADPGTSDDGRLRVFGGQQGVPVHLSRSLHALGAAMREVLPPGPCVVVSPAPVAQHHLAPALASLRAAGFLPTTVEIPDGEAHKTPETWLCLLRSLAHRGADRATPLVALGGGVTGDLVGFAAATWQRGVPVIQVPTTLLAMVDSSVGGKTAVDLPLDSGLHGRNLVGAYHHPRLVFVARDVLATLPQVELRCGMAEVIKAAVIGDASLFSDLERAGPELLQPPFEGLDPVLRASILLKSRVVAEDEHDHGARALLNLGHTVGHAVEAAAGGTLRHGLCVAMGMRAELRFSVAQGWTPPEVADRVEGLLTRWGLPLVAPSLPADALRAALLSDKKRARGKLRAVAVERIGRSRVVSIEVPRVFEMLRFLLSSAE
jgi:3-dehydroquinate synthase